VRGNPHLFIRQNAVFAGIRQNAVFAGADTARRAKTPYTTSENLPCRMDESAWQLHGGSLCPH
jgi:hypothetical protein